MSNQTQIPYAMIRGGSSKGIYLLESDLPQDPHKKDEVLKWLMGAYGDPRQIDGLGGADPLSSKIAIVKRSERDGCDIDYSFIQAIVGEDRLDPTPNCGNILAGVGAFALETGLIEAQGDKASLSIFMTNSEKICRLEFPIQKGLPIYEGEAQIDGVFGTSAAVMCLYQDLAGSLCGAMLPTGQVCDIIDDVRVTCIDNGMPVVMLRCEDFGLTGQETPQELNQNEALKQRLESIRLQAGPMMNLGDVAERAAPKMCLVSPAQNGGSFSTRTFIPKTCHKAIGVLGAVTAASAACLQASAIADLALVPDGAQKTMRIEHPSGMFDVQLGFEGEALSSAGLMRTTRLLAKGIAFVPSSIWKGSSDE